jgi:hypothetical protein
MMSNVEMGMPLFTTNSLTSPLPYQSGALTYDPVLVDSYNIQQANPMGYIADVPQNVSQARPILIQQMLALQEAHTTFSTDQHPSKYATASPLQLRPSYHESSYGAELEHPHLN